MSAYVDPNGIKPRNQAISRNSYNVKNLFSTHFQNANTNPKTICLLNAMKCNLMMRCDEKEKKNARKKDGRMQMNVNSERIENEAERKRWIRRPYKMNAAAVMRP